MHHGYYPTPDYSDHLQAQVDMIDRAVDWAYGEDLKSANPKTVVDVGCGVGGSSRHILKRFSMQSGNGTHHKSTFFFYLFFLLLLIIVSIIDARNFIISISNTKGDDLHQGKQSWR